MSPIFEYAADLYREMRAEWYVYLEAEYAQAEAGSGGAMLNVQGRRDAIDPFSLLTGPWSRVIRYAAPELIEWFESHGRPSPSQFEREWFTSWLGEMPEPDAVDAAIPAGTAVRLKDYPSMLGWPSLQVGRIDSFEIPGPGLVPLYNIAMESGARIEMVSADSFVVLHERHKADC